MLIKKLINLCLVVNFKSAQKYAIFGSVLAFYSIRAKTTLTMVDCGSPWLRIPKCGCLKKIGLTRYRADLSGYLVPAL